MGSFLCFFRDKTPPKIIVRREGIDPELYTTTSKNPYIDISYDKNNGYIVNYESQKKIF